MFDEFVASCLEVWLVSHCLHGWLRLREEILTPSYYLASSQIQIQTLVSPVIIDIQFQNLTIQWFTKCERWPNNLERMQQQSETYHTGTEWKLVFSWVCIFFGLRLAFSLDQSPKECPLPMAPIGYLFFFLGGCELVRWRGYPRWFDVPSSSGSLSDVERSSQRKTNFIVFYLYFSVFREPLRGY